MKQILFLIIVYLFSINANADVPGFAYQYERYSENGTYYFKSIPYYNYDLTSFGKTLVYDAKKKKLLYKLDNFLPTEAFISNTGKTLLTTTYWMWGHSDFEKQTLVKIYIQNSDTIQYYIDDLISDKSKLKQTVSHTLWYKEMFVINDTLNILTLDNKVVQIEMINGKIVEIIPMEKCNYCLKLEELKQPKSKYYNNIKYPEGYIFPDLKTGESFHESLIKGLNKIEVEDYSDCKYYIKVYGAIGQSGNCEIFALRANINEKENDELKKQVSDWVTKQKYKTNLIPKNCDKWVFQECFYLK